MYCPRCGQQPAYESLRFCPSCGLRLDAVLELLASNGAPAQLGDAPKRHGMRQGAKLMLFSLVALPLCFAACFAFDSGIPLLVPLTIFLAGVAWLSYYKAFGADLSGVSEQKTIRPGTPMNALRQPEPYAAPVDQPQSVAEPTTRFFHRS